MALFPNQEKDFIQPLGFTSKASLPAGLIMDDKGFDTDPPDNFNSKNTIINNNEEGKQNDEQEEIWWHTALQVAIPFFIAGIGTIAAGLVLDFVQNWKVYKAATSLFILIPSLLGLKGNLDTCLASRLSTQANLGNMMTLQGIWKMVLGNVALVQVQAIVASLAVSFFAVSVSAIKENNFVIENALLLCAASLMTATSSCFLLDLLLIITIFGTNKLKMNPDNLAAPLAASIGDVVSVTLLSYFSSFLYDTDGETIWILLTVICIYLLLLPFWILIVYNNEFTKHILTTGWVPVLSALFISGMGGLVLDSVVNSFKGFVVFQPIINGIGGNLVSVQASRISTMLHKRSFLGVFPSNTKILVLPWNALFIGGYSAQTAKILIGMSLVGQTIFMFAADFCHANAVTITPAFALSYLTVTLIQIMLLLYTAHVLVHTMWRYKIDPDDAAIPYLTAMGDLFGTLLLAGAFMFLISVRQPYEQ